MGDDDHRRKILRRCLKRAGYGTKAELIRREAGNPYDPQKAEQIFDWFIVYLDEHGQLGWVPFNGSLTKFNNTFESLEKDKTLRFIVGAKPLRWKSKK